MSDKTFRIEQYGGPEDGNDTMGGALPYENPYVSLYGALVSGRHPSKLDVGETCIQRYAMSGQKPTDYRVRRVS